MDFLTTNRDMEQVFFFLPVLAVFHTIDPHFC